MDDKCSDVAGRGGQMQIAFNNGWPMIHAFGLLVGRELDAPQAITGGIVLIATAFGFDIAITAIPPVPAAA